MLVEINLLPQKEPKKVSVLVISSVLIALFLLVTAFYFYQIKTAKNEISSLDKQMADVQKLEAELQKQQGTGASTNSVTQLKTAITWADKNRIETIPVMHHLTSLLPERGFIQTFTYQESATTLTVQFDTSQEAASYLDSLNHSSWITSASLKSLNAVSDTGTTAASQTNTTTVPSNSESNSTTATVGSNTTSTATAQAEADSNILPRYTGSFEIQFNKEAIKKAVEDSKKDGSLEEGVTGS